MCESSVVVTIVGNDTVDSRSNAITLEITLVTAYLLEFRHVNDNEVILM